MLETGAGSEGIQPSKRSTKLKELNPGDFGDGRTSNGSEGSIMRLTATLTIVLTAALSVGAVADDRSANDPPPANGAKSPANPSAGRSAKSAQRTEYAPCIGRGYVPYAYPAVDSCQCGSDCCFNAGRYYCGGKPYRRQWFKTWLRAHLGKGSMLDQYPCECQFPTVGRTYVSSRPAMRAKGPVPPKPTGQPN